MLGFTLIYRHSDALPLSADVEGASSGGAAPLPGATDLKHTAKNLLLRLSPGAKGGAASKSYFAGGNSLLQIDYQNDATFVVLLDRGVLFLTVNLASGCAGSPGSANAVSVAAAYLEEIAREFGEQFGEQVGAVSRPFPFLRFDSFLSRTKKMFVGSSRQQQADGLRRQGAAQASKTSFYKIMGYVEPVSSDNNSSAMPPIPGTEKLTSGQVKLIMGGVMLLFLIILIWVLLKIL